MGHQQRFSRSSILNSNFLQACFFKEFIILELVSSARARKQQHEITAILTVKIK